MANWVNGVGNRIAPARFVLFILLFGACFIGYRQLSDEAGLADAVAMAFDGAAFAFLVSLAPLIRNDDARTMRQDAAANDANRVVVLLISTVVALVILAAISGELHFASVGNGEAMAKLFATLALTWLFANSVYALHYAHIYYSRRAGGDGDVGGIDFPGESDPDYLDFFYFSFTLGMTFQTSDAQISGRQIRRIATLHAVVAFIFNIGIIAFAINAMGSG